MSEKRREPAKDPAKDEESKGQYGGLEGGIGPGGGTGFEEAERPARPDDERLKRKDPAGDK